MRTVRERLAEIRNRSSVPGRDELLELVDRAAEALSSEDPAIRPRDASGLPGGFVRLERGLPAILVPDLHARPGFVSAALAMELSSSGARGRSRRRAVTTLDAIAGGDLALVFLGDAFHAERGALDRWLAAYGEFRLGRVLSAPMGEEMRDGLAAVSLVLELKAAFPRAVHFLKGNHENARNEEGGGNHPFGKFAEEGRMTREWLAARYGIEALERYARMERSLPVCLAGDRFVASHAEPARGYALGAIVNARENPEVVEGLTWTDNGEAADGSAQAILDECLPDVQGARYFVGHRCVSGGYALRANGKVVQIHDPDAYQVAFVPPDRAIDFSRDLRRLTG
ncbi:MAG TPA: hypothetical protein PKL75_05310 [Treponemataceae bacterium]|nr:hypothetical protein [Treponemataceae bacterium]